MLVGLIGWRGMVGSVLIKRMVAEGDFKEIGIRGSRDRDYWECTCH